MTEVQKIQVARDPKETHIFMAYLVDVPGVLNRVTSLFSRRSYNILSLAVGRTEKPGVSRMTVVIEADDAAARLIEANLYKLVNVLRVEDVTDEPTVVRDLALIKVKADADARAKILQLCEVFRARPVDITPTGLMIEGTGNEDKIQGLIDVLEPFGIVELVRTGPIAMTRGLEPMTANPHFVNALAPDSESA